LDQMLADGFISEVEELYSRGDLSDTLPSMKSVGYRQIWQFLSGQFDYKEMVEKSNVATRQLAKRQYTWLRSWPSLHILKDGRLDSRDKVLNYCQSISILRD
jgi:tRNA dimethylallyltransferase